MKSFFLSGHTLYVDGDRPLVGEDYEVADRLVFPEKFLTGNKKRCDQFFVLKPTGISQFENVSVLKINHLVLPPYLFPRATSQADMLACPFGDCREGQIPRSSAALQV